MANRRNITAADIQAAYSSLASRAVEEYNTEHQVEPRLRLVWLGTEPGKIKRTEPASGPWLNLLSDDRQMLREVIRGLLRGPGDRPHLVAQVALVEIAVYRGKSMETLERVQNPIATDGIMVAVHTQDQTYGAVSQVDLDTGYCVLADLDVHTTFAGQLSMAEASTTRH